MAAPAAYLEGSLLSSSIACQAPIGLFINTATGEAVTATCNRWHCRACGPRRKRRFVARIMQRPVTIGYMVTLTLDGDGEASRENLARLARGWRSLCRWLTRRTGDRCAHRFRNCPIGPNRTWVRELGERNGRLHQHILIDCDFLCYFCARDAVLRTKVLGAVVDFKPIRGSARAAGYVAKYLAKAADDHRWRALRCARRTQTTIPDFPRSPDWIIELTERMTSADRKHIERLDARRGEPVLSAIAGELNPPGWSPQLSLALSPKRKCVSAGMGDANYAEKTGYRERIRDNSHSAPDG